MLVKQCYKLNHPYVDGLHNHKGVKNIALLTLCLLGCRCLLVLRGPFVSQPSSRAGISAHGPIKSVSWSENDGWKSKSCCF